MITKIYSVYDNAVQAYLPPMQFRTRGEAIRAVSAALREPDHQFSKHSPDYSLFELGEFDDSNAKYTLHPSPENCGVLTEFRDAA